MKIYGKAFLVSALFAVGLASAQGAKCEPAYKLFKETIFKGDLKQASLQLEDLKKECVAYTEGIYTYGDRVMLYQVEVARTPEDRKKAAEDVLDFYALQQKNFPAGDARVRKALLLSDNGGATAEELYKMLDEVFTMHPESFTDYRAFELYFKYVQQRYNDKKDSFDVFLKRYSDISARVSAVREDITQKRQAIQAKEANGEELVVDEKIFMADTKVSESALDAVADNISKLGSGLFSCEKLEEYYTPLYEKNKEVTSWLQGVANTLKACKCYKSQLLFNASTVLHKQHPTYQSAYDLAYLLQKRGDSKQALLYYAEAAEKQPNAIKKAELYMTVAGLYRNVDKAKAKEYALKAAAVNEKSGRPYLFIAELYTTVTAKDCDLTDFDRKALVWAALNMLKKAEVAEPKFKETVASLEQEYSKNIPTKKEAKAVKKSKGDVITYGCWINESVTLPKLK